jgi:thiamine-phosphate pyrophosphorylase
MISDRHRLADPCGESLVTLVGAAARAGVHLVQIRERDLDGRALVGLVARCVRAVRGTRARVLVNDRVDVAMAAGADGVHLRGDSMPADRVRAIAPRTFLVGRSVHSADEAARVAEGGGLDYVIFGPVFATTSKRGAVPAGVGALTDVVAATTLPVIAVGGITEATAHEVEAAGAAGVAAIGLFADGAIAELPRVIARIMRTSPAPGPALSEPGESKG